MAKIATGIGGLGPASRVDEVVASLEESAQGVARVDLHMHTDASPDCISKPIDVVRRCLARGLTQVCITDHDSIAGAIAVQRLGLADVIVGQEISTGQGDLIGLFLSEAVPPGQGAARTAEMIRQQGGLVYLPHPFDHLRKCLDADVVADLVDQVDIVETFNARCFRRHMNRQAEELANRWQKPRAAASDAHTLGEIALAFVEMNRFDGPKSFLAGLGSARLTGHSSSPQVHLLTQWAKLNQRWRRRGLGLSG